MKPKYLYYYLRMNKTHPSLDHLPTLEGLKKAYIRYLLQLTGFDICEAASILKVSPRSLESRTKEDKT
ncbi:MAG: hypothetical protein ACE5L7_03875 [Candidatus Aminicenantales bacterium]